MDHTIALIRKSHDGDKAAREQLVEENIGLIWCVVKRFGGRGVETEDLFQIGSIGLLKAIDKFDLSYDVKFSTYAVPMISGEIKRFLRDDGMLKVSRSLKELAYKSLKAGEKLTDRLGREPTMEELSEELGVRKKSWYRRWRRAQRWIPSTGRSARKRGARSGFSTRLRKKKRARTRSLTGWC